MSEPPFPTPVELSESLTNSLDFLGEKKIGPNVYFKKSSRKCSQGTLLPTCYLLKWQKIPFILLVGHF